VLGSFANCTSFIQEVRVLKIAICDDISAIADKIEDILENYGDLNNLDLDILQFIDTESVEEHLLNGNSIDLIFLDIEFPEKSGIDLANFIRNIKKDCVIEIIFISGSDKYFRDLLEFQPISFISKPFVNSDIIKSFEVFLKRLDALSFKFQYKSGGTSHLVPLNEIFYFESEGKKINIYSEKNTDSFYGTFSELSEEFNRNIFIRIHKSYIVNFDKVTSITRNNIILSNGIELPIGRKYCSQVEDAILKMRSYG
jgi:DNA-binding LytR/AlgR family response regulator